MAPKRLPLHVPIALLLSLSAFCFGAITRAAVAEHFHTNCVGHGFVHGSDTNDGSFFSRVDHGCGSGTKTCDIYTWGSYVGGLMATGASTCNAWSRSFGNFTECASTAHVSYGGVFSNHVHKAHNWCG